MKKTTLLALLTCATLTIITPGVVQAQNGPGAVNGAAPGGPGRAGGGRGFGGRGQAQPPGPPAPVPPEVAIPRPTQDEMAKLNADLKAYIAKSPDKDLLQRWESLLTIQTPRDNACIRPVQTGVRTTARHNWFVATATNSETYLVNKRRRVFGTGAMADV